MYHLPFVREGHRMPRPAAAAGAQFNTRLRSISAFRYVNYALLPYTYMHKPLAAINT